MGNELVILDSNTQLATLNKNKEGIKVLELSNEILTNLLDEEVLKAYALSGIDVKNPGRIKVIVETLVQEIRKKYKSFSYNEIREAFRDGLVGEYGDFNTGLPFTSFAKFLKGYKKRKEEVMNETLGRQEAQRSEIDTKERAEQIEALQSKFLEKKMQGFEELVNQCVVHIEDGECFSMVVEDQDVSSVLNAIEKYTDLSLTSAQIDWVDEVVKSVQYSFDIDKRSVDKGEYQKRKKLCQHRHKERLILELFLCKRLKEETQINPTKIFMFTIEPNYKKA
jgi:hypothetical protein